MDFDFYVCPKKYSYRVNYAEKVFGKNTQIKDLVTKGVTEIVKNNISKEDFLRIVGKEIELGNVRKKVIDMTKVYDLVNKYKEYISLQKQIIKIEFSTPAGYDTHPYYIIKQILEQENKPMYFCTIILKVEPAIDFYELCAQSDETVAKVNMLSKAVDKAVVMTQDFYPTYTIMCNTCAYAHLCKPINIKQNDGEENAS